MAVWDKCAFALLIDVDLRLCQTCFRDADRGYTAPVGTTESSSSGFALLLGIDVRLCLSHFRFVKSRARLCLRELVLPIAVDIQGLQTSFRFSDRGGLPLWSTRLCRLE